MKNCNKQNEKIELVDEKTLVIGVDVGSYDEYARAFTNRKIELSKKPLRFHNTAEGFKTFKSWAVNIMKANGLEKIIVGMEPTSIYWEALATYCNDNGMILVHVNPAAVHKSKELDDNDPSKNDMTELKYFDALKDRKSFTTQEILDSFRKGGFTLSDASFYKQLSKMVKEEKLIRVGSGIYCFRDKDIKQYEHEYSDLAVEVADLIRDQFPLVNFSVMELNQLNDFVNHQIAHNTLFVSVEADVMEFVFEALRDRYFWKVFINPPKEIYHQYWSDNMIIINKLVTEAPRYSDVSTLLNVFTDFKKIRPTYEKISKSEVAYRGIDCTSTECLWDTFNTAMCIAGRGKVNDEEYSLYVRGIRELRDHIYFENYTPEIAAERAPEIMYMVLCLLTDTEFIHVENSSDFINEKLENERLLVLHYLRKVKPEAYAYVVKTDRLLTKILQ